MVRKSWCLLPVIVAIAHATTLTPFSLEEFLSGQFSQRGFGGTWISDTEFTYTIPGEPGINIFDVTTLETKVLVSGELMASLNTDLPILSADRQYILARSEVKQVYRYSSTAKFMLYHIATRNNITIADHQRLQLCIFGGGHSLAYVLDNDLYYLPGNASEAIRITTDGVPGVIYNGHTDWVYEEDVIYSGQATWFSPDGSYLAFASFDDTLVDTYSYYYYEDTSNPEDILYPELVDLKYPKVGRTNPTVRLRLVKLVNTTNGVLEYKNITAPPAVSDDHILGGVRWATATEIAVLWLNRRQNYAILRILDVVTGEYVDEVREQPNGWVPISLPRFSSKGDFYVSTRWSEEQNDGERWQHLYLNLRVNGEIKSTSITPGAITVTNFVGMNEEDVLYYYTRTVSEDVKWRSQLYVAGTRSECISCSLRGPEGLECAWVTATASHSASYLTITCASSSEPSATYIYDVKKRDIIHSWEINGIVRERLQDKLRPQSLIFTVPLENGHPASVRLFVPPGVNLLDTETKYPLVYYVYSGPNTNTVYDTFTVGYHSYLTTNRSMIYMLADGRGAGLHGQNILYALNNKLGTVEVEDHFVILRQVLDLYPGIDREKVGIWGHSYGGYATLLTMAHDDEKLFRCGVSGAPVTSWLYYNTMYTERYMGLPTAEDNLVGYQTGDVTLLAEKLRGHDFYVMHGNADDNVHYQNAAKLFTALQKLNIPFEQMSYPDEAHSLVGVNLHRYNTMDKYWNKCFNLS